MSKWLSADLDHNKVLGRMGEWENGRMGGVVIAEKDHHLDQREREPNL